MLGIHTAGATAKLSGGSGMQAGVCRNTEGTVLTLRCVAKGCALSHLRNVRAGTSTRSSLRSDSVLTDPLRSQALRVVKDFGCLLFGQQVPLQRKGHLFPRAHKLSSSTGPPSGA